MRRKLLVFLRLRTTFLFTILFLTSVVFVSAQETEKKDEKKETEKPQTVQQNPIPNQQILDVSKNLTADGVAESAILIYGGFYGRATLNQIRKTTFERGRMKIVNSDGSTDNANYQRWIMRGDSLEKEKNRFEQEYPNTKYSLVYDGEKTFGVFNNTIFTPRDTALNSFQNQIWHGLEALLRYKENGAKVDLVKKDKLMGVEFYIVDVTDKGNRKTRFYVSSKTFRVMMLEYEEEGVKYKRKFYNYNYSQGTLVPYRTVLWADDKQVEETDIMTITFGQKIEENLFAGK